MSTIELFGSTALFGVFFETTKNGNLTDLGTPWKVRLDWVRQGGVLLSMYLDIPWGVESLFNPTLPVCWKDKYFSLLLLDKLP